MSKKTIKPRTLELERKGKPPLVAQFLMPVIKTTDIEDKPAHIAIMGTNENKVVLAITGECGKHIDMWLDLNTIKELHTALGKLLEVAS